MSGCPHIAAVHRMRFPYHYLASTVLCMCGDLSRHHKQRRHLQKSLVRKGASSLPQLCSVHTAILFLCKRPNIFYILKDHHQGYTFLLIPSIITEGFHVTVKPLSMVSEGSEKTTNAAKHLMCHKLQKRKN
jgi:hypothetical protein